MKPRAATYLLALLGAALGVFGDICGTQAARGWRPALATVLGTLAWACCYPIWYWLSRRTGGGFAAPGAMWTVASAVLGAIAIVAFHEQESAGKRALLVVIILAGVARELIP